LLKNRLITAIYLIVPSILLLVLAEFYASAFIFLSFFATSLNVCCVYEFSNLNRITKKDEWSIFNPFLLALPSVACTLALSYFCIFSNFHSTAVDYQRAIIFAGSIGFFFLIFSLSYFLAKITYIASRADSIKLNLDGAQLSSYLILLLGSFGFTLVAFFPKVAFWLTFTVCLNDTFAYFVGKVVGGKLLSPLISPNKTLSGAFAGFVGGIVASLIALPFLLPEFGKVYSDLFIMLSLAIAVVFLAQIGDLNESWFKRVLGVKDSSNILAGHGGFYDRFDALIAVSLIIGPFSWLVFLLKSINL
jgi:CDP-diglyceride synthetase